MISISLCMIVKNEESCLDQCLASVKDLVDEIIVVDTGSTDQTEEIIKKYCDTVHHFEWINDFSAARNYAFSLATKDYILWLDADDVLLPKDQELFKQMKETLSTTFDYVSMIYDITFNEKGECTLSIPRDKMVKNNGKFYWRYFVHEELVVSGNLLPTQIHITHTSDHGHYSRYLHNYEQRIADGYELLPHEKYFYGGELIMSEQYEKCISVLEDFLLHPSDNAFEINRSYDFLNICYQKTGQIDLAIQNTLKSFLYKAPTSDTCYYLANFFLSKKEFNNAIFWFNSSLTCEPSISKERQIDANLQLCISYYSIGDAAHSLEANNKVLALDPSNGAGLFNKMFFDSHKS